MDFIPLLLDDGVFILKNIYLLLFAENGQIHALKSCLYGLHVSLKLLRFNIKFPTTSQMVLPKSTNILCSKEMVSILQAAEPFS